MNVKKCILGALAAAALVLASSAAADVKVVNFTAYAQDVAVLGGGCGVVGCAPNRERKIWAATLQAAGWSCVGLAFEGWALAVPNFSAQYLHERYCK